MIKNLIVVSVEPVFGKVVGFSGCVSAMTGEGVTPGVGTTEVVPGGVHVSLFT